MSVRLVEKPADKSILISEMKDGDIGVITKWTYATVVGVVVQRYKDVLICIGEPGGSCWPSIFPIGDISCRVRLLEKGETLITE